MDDGATAQQRQALETILSGQAGGLFLLLGDLIGNNKGIAFVPIKMDTSGNRQTLSVPGVLELTNEPLINPMTEEEQEVRLENSMDPFAPSGILGKSGTATVSDPDLSFDVSGQHSYRGAFDLSGP